MNSFKRIRHSIPTAPFLREIAAIEGVWAQATGREDTRSPYRAPLAIPLRSPRTSNIFCAGRQDGQESRWTAQAAPFSLTRTFIADVAADLDADLGRARIVYLPPMWRVGTHVDYGAHDRLRRCYHLILKSGAGSSMTSGDAEVCMREGELWSIDTFSVVDAPAGGHEARGPREARVHDQAHDQARDQARVHLVFDLRPAERRDAAAAATARTRCAGLRAG